MGTRDEVRERLAALADVPNAYVLIQVAGKRRTALTLAGVAAMFGIKTATVTRWRNKSQPGGEWADTPMPAEDDTTGGRPAWLKERAGELLEWKRSLPGRGAGAGRPPVERDADGNAIPRPPKARPVRQPRQVAVPAYQRIADDLRERVRSGELKPGERLLSSRLLAGQYEVSATVISNAVLLLKGQGVLESAPFEGTRVAERGVGAQE